MLASRGQSLWDVPVVATGRRPMSRIGQRGMTPPAVPAPQDGYDQQQGGYEGGYGGMAGTEQYGEPMMMDHHDIYARAINVSSPRLKDEGDDAPLPTIQKKIVRRVEVPFTRKVKVPTTTTKIVETMVPKKVPTPRLVTVPGDKVVDEEYTVLEDREAVRDKEIIHGYRIPELGTEKIWVDRVVPDRYMTKVPVTHTRQVNKPTTVIKEVEDFAVVNVPVHQAVTVDGFRIDEVQDTKMVEVEEVQNFEMRPVPAGDPIVHGTRELGRIPNSTLSRTRGAEVFHTAHPATRSLDEDSTAGGAPAPLTRGFGGGSMVRPSYGQFSSVGSQVTNTTNTAAVGSRALAAGQDSYYNRSAALNNALPSYAGSVSLRGYHQQPAQAAYDHSGFTDPANIRPAGGYRRGATYETQPAPTSRSVEPDPVSQGGVGMTVKNTHTRHTDGTGVLVTRVDRGTPSARAGLQANDVITSVDNTPVTTVDEFRAVLARAPGPLELLVNRDGRRNISLTLYR